MKKIILSITAITFLLIILNSCTLNNAGTVSTQRGAFLLGQASPDAPTLAFIVNGTELDTGINYKTYTPYISANSGTYNFSIIRSDSGNAVSDSNTVAVSISALKDYSFFYVDSFKKVKTVFINDVFHAPGGDTTLIRFFNFCPNSPGPINLVDSSENNATLSGGRTFNDEVLNSQYTTFQGITGGTHILSLKNATGATLKTQTVVLTTGKVYTIIAKGIYGADSTKALSIGLFRKLSANRRHISILGIWFISFLLLFLNTITMLFNKQCSIMIL